MKRYFAMLWLFGCWWVSGCSNPVPLTPTPGITTPVVITSPLLTWLEANGEPAPTPQAYFGSNLPVIGVNNATQLQEIARYGKGSGPVGAWSSDGKWLAVGTQAAIYLYDAETLEEILSINQPAHYLAFWPDDSTLASIWWSSIFLWDIETGRKLDEWNIGLDFFWSRVAFSPDGHTIATSWIAGPVKVWDFEKKEEVLDFYESLYIESLGLSFSPDGQELAIGVDETVEIWDMNTLDRIKSYPSNSGWDLEFSEDGNTLAVATDDNTVELWDTQTDKLKLTLGGSEDTLYAIALLQDGSVAMAISHEETIQFRDTTDGSFIRDFPSHGESVLNLSFSPDEKRILLLSAEGILKLRDVASGTEIYTFPGFFGVANQLALSPDNRFLAASFDNQKIKVLDMNTGNWVYVLESPSPSDWDRTWSLVISPDGKLLAATADGNLKVWSMENGKEIFIPNLQPPYEGEIAFSKNGQLLALLKGNQMEFREVNTWESIGNFNLEHVGSNSPEFLSNGHLFVLSPDDPYENVLFWDPLTNGDEYLIPIPPDLTFSHTISPDGKLLAISDLVNCDVKFYSINSGINLGNLTDCQGDISRMGFSPDNLILAVAMNGGDIKFFDFNTKTEVGTVLHNSGIRVLIFSQDGRYFVTSSEDGTIRVWAVAP